MSTETENYSLRILYMWFLQHGFKEVSELNNWRNFQLYLSILIFYFFFCHVMVANILFSQTLLPSNRGENDFIFVFLTHLVLITGLGYGNCLESYGKPRLCESRMYYTAEPIKTDLNRKNWASQIYSLNNVNKLSN